MSLVDVVALRSPLMLADAAPAVNNNKTSPRCSHAFKMKVCFVTQLNSLRHLRATTQVSQSRQRPPHKH